IFLADASRRFAPRAARLRALAPGNPIGGYLQLVADLADAQQALLDDMPAPLRERLQAAARGQHAQAAAEAGMPPLRAASLQRDPCWRTLLRELPTACAALPATPGPVRGTLARLAAAPDAWLEAQADALLDAAGARDPVDAAGAPFLTAALQVYWAALGLAFAPDELAPMPDAPGLCPLCGTPPVASVVHASGPSQNYRYLACALCGCQWHYVRVQCSRCGTAGKDIAYQSLARADDDEDDAAKDSAVRAETCEHCHGYRKILYAEKDPAVEPFADDLGTLALDLLLGEQGYERASQNPMLWQASDG